MFSLPGQRLHSSKTLNCPGAEQLAQKSFLSLAILPIVIFVWFWYNIDTERESDKTWAIKKN